VVRVRERRQHLEARRAQLPAPGHADNRTDADGPYRLAEDREIVVRCTENGDAEESVPPPAVADLVGQVRLAESQGAASDDSNRPSGGGSGRSRSSGVVALHPRPIEVIGPCGLPLGWGRHRDHVAGTLPTGSSWNETGGDASDSGEPLALSLNGKP
jgi:hypothetical protein